MTCKKETLRVYNKFPEYFDKKFEEFLNKYLKEKLEEIISIFPKNAKILDLGSGPGNHALFFKQKGFDVLCLDISKEFIKKCGQKGLKTIKMDLENLDFPSDSFDVVWAYTSLLHIPKSNINNILIKIKEILKEKGFFFISMKEGTGEGFVDFKEGRRRWFSLYQQK